MTYKLSQLGHDVQNWSVTVVHAVNEWVELCRYKRALNKQTASVVVVYTRKWDATPKYTGGVVLQPESIHSFNVEKRSISECLRIFPTLKCLTVLIIFNHALILQP